MNKSILLIIFLFFFSTYFVAAQNEAVADSLFKIAQKAKKQKDLTLWFVNTIGGIGKQCGYDDSCRVKNYQKVLNELWQEPKTKEENYQLSRVYISYAYSMNSIGKYRKTKEIYETILNNNKLVTSRSEDYINIYIHQTLGNIYTRQGDYEKAINSLKLFLKSAKEPDVQGEAYNDLGKAYQSKGDLVQAAKLFKEGLMVKKLPNRGKGLLYSNIADIEFRYGNFNQAISNSEKAINFFNKMKKPNDLWIMNTYALIGKSYANLNNQNKSNIAFKSAFQAMKRRYPNTKHNRDIAKIYIQHGNALILLNKEDEALAAFQQALHAVIPSAKEADIQSNPTTEKLYPENAIVESLYGKTRILAKQYQTNNDIKTLELALECYDLVLLAEHRLRQTYQFQPSQLISVSNVRTYSETVMNMLYLAYKNTGSRKYAEKAFEISEMTKAAVLKERLLNIHAKLNFLPKELQDRDWSFQKQLTTQYQALTGETEEKRADIYKTITQLTINYDQFLDSLSKEYPDYVNSKSTIETIDIKSLKKQFVKNDKKVLIEYYFGETTQYVFVLSQKKGLEFIKLGAFDTTYFQHFYKYLYQKNIENKSFDAITNDGYKIYQHYFKSLNLDAAIEEIIVIPDGQLSYLAFGALVKNIPDVPNGAFHQLPYLAMDYVFSYNYSAGILLELKEQEKKYSNSFLGFAPTFDKAIFKKNNLDKTEEEVTNIAQLFGNGKPISGELATKTQFLEMVNQYGVLHLATHASAYDSTMKEGAIYFSDEMLTLQEIYNLPLSAQLAVLSACESGTGTMATGEGVMSLARAFMYQGVPSVVASLWNANDKSTNEIMLKFYQYLKDGKPKAVALKMAKEHYLNSSSVKNAHPFYWSSMMMIGDNSELTFYNNDFYKWLILGLLIFSLITFFIFRRGKS